MGMARKLLNNERFPFEKPGSNICSGESVKETLASIKRGRIDHPQPVEETLVSDQLENADNVEETEVSSTFFNI